MSRRPLPRLLAGVLLVAGLIGALGACGDGTTVSDPPRRSVTETVTSSAPRSADFDPDGLVGGNAQPSFGPGTSDQLAVAETGLLHTSNTSVVTVAVRNNTSSPVTDVQVSAAAPSTSSGATATGSGKGSTPVTLAPGEAGLVAVSFPAGQPQPAGDSDPADYTYRVTSATAPGRSVDLKVSGTSNADAAISGTATNDGTAEVHGPYPVSLFCFDSTGRPSYAASSYAGTAGPLQPGQALTFDIGLRAQCRTYLVGVSAQRDQ